MTYSSLRHRASKSPLHGAALIAAVVLVSWDTPAARPRYGGAIRIAVQPTIRSLDPATQPADAAEASIRDVILPLVFEALVAVDPERGVQPGLAAGWEQDASATRWRFTLRGGVALHDGSMLDAARLAISLSAGRSDWRVAAAGTAVTIDTGQPRPDLLWELADMRNAIAVRSSAGELIGTGPFRAERLDSSRLLLRAHDSYWGSRPFLDQVRIEFGRSLTSQLTDLETGRADIVSARPTDARRLAQRQLRVRVSRPLELFTLVFEPHRTAPLDLPLRRTLAAAIDRVTMSRVLLQGYAEPANGLLPTWLSGYPSFVVAEPGRQSTRAAVTSLPMERRSLVLRVTPGDPVAQAVADRVAVDAREAGFVMTVQAPTGLAPRADLRLVRLNLPVTSPERALAALMAALGPRVLLAATREPPPAPGAPLDRVARVEGALLDQYVIVPVVHMPALYGIADRVDSFDGRVILPSGGWNLADVWVGPDPADRP
jgi:hypothetical protein